MHSSVSCMVYYLNESVEKIFIKLSDLAIIAKSLSFINIFFRNGQSHSKYLCSITSMCNI